MKYVIKESSYPIVNITLDKDESIIASYGALCWMDNTFKFDVFKNNANENDVVGFLFSKKHFLLNKFVALKNDSKITLGTSVPGSVKAVELKAGESIVCRVDSMIFASSDVSVQVYLNKKVGFLATDAYFLEKVTGPGVVFLEIDGEAVERELKEEETVVISDGHLVSVSESCSVEVQTNRGFKKVFFSGEGFFNTTVTGPGKITLQTMSIEKLADSLDPHISHPEST